MKALTIIAMLITACLITLIAYGLYTQCPNLAPEIYQQCKTIGRSEVIVWALALGIAAHYATKGGTP